MLRLNMVVPVNSCLAEGRCMLGPVFHGSGCHKQDRELMIVENLTETVGMNCCLFLC